ncbi:siderophore-interacting protein [Ferruginibacter sp. HRS2-29]|uniref:siderophore-interacting protein n=1 Tax=Ferruginibacter sp. HRS2-29 TaxID=2487334 RepID=UPI0020CF0858|nr:FAD-binding oxidoreductase [Ferruginibacter sp. HRS2-29]MCP9751600.1 hypothetical protein [Ferruginibacter sp. HRS2-29]
MPTIPKWMGDIMESTFSNKFRSVTITHIECLSTELKKIRFKGDLSSVKFQAGQAVVFRIDGRNYRHYTPSFWDSEAGICDIVFHLHGNGPGQLFISKLKEGDHLRMGLPSGYNLYKRDSKYHFFFGDETTLGLFQSLKNLINTEDKHYIGVLELDAGSLHAPGQLGLMLDVVPKAETKALHAIRFLDELEEELWELWKTGVFYLMGNARSIQVFRNALKQRGISSKNIVTQPYWVEGKAGL